VTRLGGKEKQGDKGEKSSDRPEFEYIALDYPLSPLSILSDPRYPLIK